MSQSSIMRLSVLVALCAARSGALAPRTVRTAQGPVRGYRRGADDVYRFYGIPYATAPTGTRRFTEPLPGPMWMQPFEAINDKIICPQPNSPRIDTSKYEMREDCLVANVYVPDTEEADLPVVVYVHGGAFHVGFSDFISPVKLALSKKVVAVTFNYRLGAHGFLCLGTARAPGNAGMKDAVALLRWVRTNIASFGENPRDVTIAGYSSGSVAVELLMLSDMAKGLYRKAIPESGASLASWSLQLDPLKNAKDFARKRNFTNAEDIDALGEFYATSPFEALYMDNYLASVEGILTFAPCVERDTGVEKFLKAAPVNILLQGNYTKVPVLYGFANMEGIMKGLMFDEWIHKMNEQFSDFLPADLQFETHKEKQETAEMVKLFYFGDKPVSEETAQGYVNYFTDVAYVVPSCLRSVQLQVAAGSKSIYLYYYTFASPMSKRFPKGLKNITGATHCAQTMAVLDSKLLFSDMVETEQSETMKKIMLELWLNFITTGKPVPEGSHFPEWPPVGADRSPYMELNLNLTLKERLLEQRVRFWDAIYQKYYRAPVAPQPYTLNIRSEL